MAKNANISTIIIVHKLVHVSIMTKQHVPIVAIYMVDKIDEAIPIVGNTVFKRTRFVETIRTNASRTTNTVGPVWISSTTKAIVSVVACRTALTCDNLGNLHGALRH